MKKGCAVLLFVCLWMFLGCAASHYSLGKKHLEAEEYDQALAEFELAEAEKPDQPKVLRETGITYYRKLDFKNAIQHLLQAFLLDSTDGRTLFYLGTAFEITKKYDMALDIYSRYVDVSAASGIRSSIQGRLEKLIRLRMEEAAKRALAEEDQLDIETIPDSTVAVLYFKNMGDNRELDPIQKGLAEMVITDLSKVKSLHVIERLRIQKLMEEMGFGMTGLVDQSTAPRIGRLLGASRLIHGVFLDLSGDRLRIDAGWIPVKTRSELQTDQQTDQMNQLFKMEKNLVFGLIDRMGIDLSQEERDAIEIIPTENLLAFMAYCNALDYEDRGMFEQSAEFYREALIHDPGFAQARKKLTVAENLSAGSTDIAALEQQFAAGEAETGGPASAPAGPGADEIKDGDIAESGLDVSESVIVNQMIHSVGVLDQAFLPGIESREPAQERSESSFGSTARFHIQVTIPPE